MGTITILHLILILAALLPLSLSASGPCEAIEDLSWEWLNLRVMKTCKLKNTVINSTGFLITSDRDDTVLSLDLGENKNAEFLPENIAEKFPNLTVIYARNCALKSISRKNFRGLEKLRWASFLNNQIKQIDGDTFWDLVSLESLGLSNCKLKDFELLNNIIHFSQMKTKLNH